jgi:hypothetical protein
MQHMTVRSLEFPVLCTRDCSHTAPVTAPPANSIGALRIWAADIPKLLSRVGKRPHLYQFKLCCSAGLALPQRTSTRSPVAMCIDLSDSQVERFPMTSLRCGDGTSSAVVHARNRARSGSTLCADSGASTTHIGKPFTSIEGCWNIRRRQTCTLLVTHNDELRSLPFTMVTALAFDLHL